MKTQIFTPDARAVFVRRPNRYVVEAEKNGKILRAHCPNPGRLRELLIPGRHVILEKSDNPQRKTPWTLAAVEYGDYVIPLVSVRSNRIAGDLLLPLFHPDGRRLAEQTLGHSRIDWKVENPDGTCWIEVKACTLVEHGRAMFPDAPSVRAVKHLKELMGTKERSEVIFTVMNPSAKVFSPNPHADPDFTKTLEKARQQAGVEIRAVSMRTGPDGFVRVENPRLPVDLSPAEAAVEDSGALVRCFPGRVSLEFHEADLGRIAKLRPKGEKPSAVFLIRGRQKSLEPLAEDLETLRKSRADECWEEHLEESPDFLELILDYRHRRIFVGRGSD